MNEARRLGFSGACRRFGWVIVACVVVGSTISSRVIRAHSNRHGHGDASAKSTSYVQQLVTGDAERIANVVAGTGATLKFYFTPRPPLPGTDPSLAYPSGASIVGQKLTVSAGGFTSAWITQIEGWDPDGNGDVLLRDFQDKIDANGFKGLNASPPNPGCDLIFPANSFSCDKICQGGPYPGCSCRQESCCIGGGGRCVDTCPGMFGEPGPKCGGTIIGFCDWGWQNTQRPDWVMASILASDQISVANIVSPSGPIFAAAPYSNSELADSGGKFYAGTLILPVPACARGTYTIGHRADQTFAQDQAEPANNIPIAAMVAGVLEIPLGSCCTDFTTPSQATCAPNLLASECNALTSDNLHLFRPNIDCSTPCTVDCIIDADCDDHLACTDDTCGPDNHCTHAPISAQCDDGVPCTIDACTEPNGVCIHTSVDSTCDDGLFCNGVEVCTLTGCQPGDPPCGFGEICHETSDSCELIPIPTVSQWGLTVLGLLALIAGKIRFRVDPCFRR